MPKHMSTDGQTQSLLLPRLSLDRSAQVFMHETSRNHSSRAPPTQRPPDPALLFICTSVALCSLMTSVTSLC